MIRPAEPDALAHAARRLTLGPGDHGRPLTRDEYERAEYLGTWLYELVDGRLYVSPSPSPTHDWATSFLESHLRAHAAAHPEAFDHVTERAEVFRGEGTRPQPDLAAYRGYPRDPRALPRTWEAVSPVLVVEVISPGDPHKDLARNRRIYGEVASIEEYWIVDPRPASAGLLVLARPGPDDAAAAAPDGWVEHPVPLDGAWESRRFPGLVVRPAAFLPT